jgi:dTDP-4-dehydrorhamnose reductase
VFSGLRPAPERWVESDLPEPVNAYGRAKLAAEVLVQEANVRWLITRVADVYGVNMSKAADQSSARHVWEHSGSALRLVGRLREGRTLPAPADVHRSPTYAWDYAQRVCELVAQRREGVLHTAGPESMHRREYLRLLARAFARAASRHIWRPVAKTRVCRCPRTRRWTASRPWRRWATPQWTWRLGWDG